MLPNLSSWLDYAPPPLPREGSSGKAPHPSKPSTDASRVVPSHAIRPAAQGKEEHSPSDPSPSATVTHADPSLAAPTLRPTEENGARPQTQTLPTRRARPERLTIPDQPVVSTSEKGAEGQSKDSHGPSRSPPKDSDDDDFVFVLHDVHSTREAIEKVREVQSGQRAPAVTIYKGPPHHHHHHHHHHGGVHGSARTARSKVRRRSELPETLNDFYECPNYTVSLVVAREAIFEDALSGFHSLAQREEAEAEAFRQKKMEAERARKQALAKRANEKARLREEGERQAHGQKQSCRRSSAATVSTNDDKTPSAGQSKPQQQQQQQPKQRPLESTTHEESRKPRNAMSTSDSAALQPSAPVSGKSKDADEDDIPASLMFLWRSRDEAALRSMTSQTMDPDQRSVSANASFGKAMAGVTPAEKETPLSVSPPGKASQTPPIEDAHATQTRAQQEMGIPYPSGAAAAAPRLAKEYLSPAELAAEEEALRERQYLTFLKEKEFARQRAPEVFRFLYPPLLDFTRFGGNDLTDPVEIRVLKKQAYRNPENRIIKEWLYVWEQFERDIHREVLLIEDESYNQADDAVAAILSYVEHSYDRGRAAALEKLNLSNTTPASSQPSKAVTAGDSNSATTPSPTTAEKKPEKKGFFDSISAAFKDVALKAHDTLPSFMADPLISASGLSAEAVRATTAYPADPMHRGRKIFNAVREVVLASQQSFMGFPYQLLCEQVGTERLALALEEYMEEEEEALRQQRELIHAASANDLADVNIASEEASAPIRISTPLALPSAAIPVSAFGNGEGPVSRPASLPQRTPFGRSANGRSLALEGSPLHASGSLSLRRDGSTRFDPIVSTPASPLMPPASPLAASRVLRIYHGGPNGNERSSKRKERSPSASESPFEEITPNKADAVKSQGAPTAAETPSAVTAPPADPSPDRSAPQGEPNGKSSRAPSKGEKPPSPNSVMGSSTATPSVKGSTIGRPDDKDNSPAAALRRLEEERRKREKKLPLLVGEPRPAEFKALLSIIKAKVNAKNAREDKDERHHGKQEAEKVGRQETETTASRKPEGSSQTPLSSSLPSQPASSSAPRSSAPPDYHRRHGLFRADVDGSAYLLPVNQRAPSPQPQQQPQRSPNSPGEEKPLPLDADAPPLSRSASVSLGGSMAASSVRHTQGMRVLLYFNPKRNAPVVCVNKVFRLFTVPGLRSFATNVPGSAPATRPNSEDDLFATLDGAEEEDNKSLLLLIQIEFSLFTQEEAEVRWRWYTVTT